MLLRTILPVCLSLLASSLSAVVPVPADVLAAVPDYRSAGLGLDAGEIPRRPVTRSVADYGAIPDDDEDDTSAFEKALAVGGVIAVPPGRFIIRNVLRIGKSGTVLRGSGRGKTVLSIPISLTDIQAKPTTNSGGRPTSSYSWSGGFIAFDGRLQGRDGVAVAGDVATGADKLTVVEAGKFVAGDFVRIALTGDTDGTLWKAVYAGDPGPSANVKVERIHPYLYARVASADGTEVTLSRRLPLALRQEWKPVIEKMSGTVMDAGIEALTILFPVTPYKGHFTEVGYNGIAMGQAMGCWLDDVEIRNSDSGIFLSGVGNTLENVALTSERGTSRGITGHHGITIGSGGGNLVRGFTIDTRFIHDLTVVGFANGNVFTGGKAADLTMDHHCWAPFGNLFSNIDAGRGSDIFHCGGGDGIGKHAGIANTYWNIRTENPQSVPPWRFGPDGNFFIGIRSDKTAAGAAFVWLPSTAAVEPPDLFSAQRSALR